MYKCKVSCSYSKTLNFPYLVLSCVVLKGRCHSSPSVFVNNRILVAQKYIIKVMNQKSPNSQTRPFFLHWALHDLITFHNFEVSQGTWNHPLKTYGFIWDTNFFTIITQDCWIRNRMVSVHGNRDRRTSVCVVLSIVWGTWKDWGKILQVSIYNILVHTWMHTEEPCGKRVNMYLREAS